MFEMSLSVAEEFYERCIAVKATTQKQKMEILLELAKEGKLRSVIETKRTPDQVARDMAKNFGRVLYIKPELGEGNEADRKL